MKRKTVLLTLFGAFLVLGLLVLFNLTLHSGDAFFKKDKGFLVCFVSAAMGVGSIFQALLALPAWNKIRVRRLHRKIIHLLFFLLIFHLPDLHAQLASEEQIFSQLINLNAVRNGNEDYQGYEQLKGVLDGKDIVFLGEQSHGEKTVYETKLKLIKYLHEEMGYNILAFEASFFECHVAWDSIQNGSDVRLMFGKSVPAIWSFTKEMKGITDYIQKTLTTDQPLVLLGFDNQWTSMLNGSFLPGLKKYLGNEKRDVLGDDSWHSFETTIEKFRTTRKISKKEARKDTLFINNLVRKLEKIDNVEAGFWSQSLKSLKVFLSDSKLGTDLRDYQMAKNIEWIRKQYLGEKIIGWAATSHILYESHSVRLIGLPGVLVNKYYRKHLFMGGYLKAKYPNQLFTIGFLTSQGYYGFRGFSRKKKIKHPKSNSLEYRLSNSKYENCLLPLKGLELDGFLTRPLGHFWMKNDISDVLDAIVFNRNMERPEADLDFILNLYPNSEHLRRLNESER